MTRIRSCAVNKNEAHRESAEHSNESKKGLKNSTSGKDTKNTRSQNDLLTKPLQKTLEQLAKAPPENLQDANHLLDDAVSCVDFKYSVRVTYANFWKNKPKWHGEGLSVKEAMKKSACC